MAITKSKTKTVANVSVQRQAVQALIANARGAEAALLSAEHALTTLDSAVASYAA